MDGIHSARDAYTYSPIPTYSGNRFLTGKKENCTMFLVPECVITAYASEESISCLMNGYYWPEYGLTPGQQWFILTETKAHL